MERAYIGRYRVLAELGSGGMGLVVRAMDEVRAREVAIKLPRASDPDVVKRLRQEYDVLAQLQHHHIVEIFGSGSDTDVPFYVVMEYVDGVTVEELLQHEGPFETRQALKMALGVAEALAHAHRPPLRVIHRDIKPGNVLVRRSDGVVKVTDFGIAAVLSQRGGNTAVGTLAYIAPEQALGQGADERSDLYSLGVLLYEMLTGQRPPQLAAAPAPPPSTVPGSRIAPELFDRVDRLVLGLLERDPARRAPKSADEVAEELRAMLEGRSSRLLSSGLGASPFEPTHRASRPPQVTRYPAPASSALPPVGTPSGYLAERAAQARPAPPPAPRPPPAPFQPPPIAPPMPQPVQIVPYVVPVLPQPVYQVVQVVPVIPARPNSGKAIASLVLGIVLMASGVFLFPFVLSFALLAGSSSDEGYTPDYSGPLVVTLIWLLFALLPVLFGHLALRDIKRSGGQLAGTGLAIAGLVLGYLGAAGLFLLLLRFLTLL